MPLLDEDKRQSIDARLSKRQEIEQRFEGRQYISQHCRLCNWASNGLTLDEACEENDKHERSHPEYAEWEASQLGFEEIRESLHDHECQRDAHFEATPGHQKSTSP